MESPVDFEGHMIIKSWVDIDEKLPSAAFDELRIKNAAIAGRLKEIPQPAIDHRINLRMFEDDPWSGAPRTLEYLYTSEADVNFAGLVNESVHRVDAFPDRDAILKNGQVHIGHSVANFCGVLRPPTLGHPSFKQRRRAFDVCSLSNVRE
jgi:hypothetical protein